jgi:diaminopimelate decarboxylase
MALVDGACNSWRPLLTTAAELCDTPCYVVRWRPVAEAVASLERMAPPDVTVRSWLSFKTHPVLPLLRRWLQSGRGVEVVSECEFVTATRAGADTDHLLVNGVAKHAWLTRFDIPRLRVHFDSLSELRQLIGQAVTQRWQVGIRCHAPDESDLRDDRFRGQFGMTEDEAVTALVALREAGADLQGLHFHLGSGARNEGAYGRAVDRLRRVCERASFRPRYVDFGGGLPARSSACVARDSLGQAIAAAAAAFSPQIEEVWLENGRYVTGHSTALVVRVLDVKQRDDSTYLICDGGRTNQALAADAGLHPLLVLPHRTGHERLTTVCGPTCMTDDVLARVQLPEDVGCGDLLAWMDAGAYHLPWETRFSQGQCAVAWCDGDDGVVVARRRESPHAWADAWSRSAA